jgi:hypothetical protein
MAHAVASFWTRGCRTGPSNVFLSVNIPVIISGEKSVWDNIVNFKISYYAFAFLWSCLRHRYSSRPKYTQVLENWIYWSLTRRNYKSSTLYKPRSFPSSSVFTRRFLVTASNNCYSSASVLKSRTELTLNWLSSKSKLRYDRRSVGQWVLE